MEYKEFFDRLETMNLPRALLLHGEEEYIKETALSRLRAALLPEGLEMMNEVTFEGAVEENVITEACDTLPFMAERRLVIVKEHPLMLNGAKGGDGARLIAYLDELPDYVMLAFVVRGGADMRRRLPAAIAKRGGAVIFKPMEERDIAAFLRREARKQDKKLSDSAAQRLIFLCGNELSMLTRELEKAAAYVGDKEEIATADIDAIAVPGLEANVYHMVDALLDGKNARAEEMCRTLLRDGESPVRILAILTRNLRQLYHARVLLDAKRPRPEIEKAVGVSGYVAGRVLQRAGSFGADWLRDAQNACADADYDIKSGKVREDIALGAAMARLMVRPCKG